jgi:MEMO1 family protein
METTAFFRRHRMRCYTGGARSSCLMGLTFAGLLPHPPIVVPAVGGERGVDCRRTTDACRRFATELLATDPERLILVSPHSPRVSGAFGCWSGERLVGDLGRFGASQEQVDLPRDGTFVAALEETAGEQSIPLEAIPSDGLDHGAVVPLWFLCEAGWKGPTSILSLPWPVGGQEIDATELACFGGAVERSAEAIGGRYALIASGDMTHRGKRGAPAGYHPRAAEFDTLFVDRVTRGELSELSTIPADLRELAAEDVVDTSVLVTAAHDFLPHAHRTISYECPFGVGYLVAVFYDAGAPERGTR